MLFHTLDFAFFFIIVFTLYWILQKKEQNLLLLIASYIFYGYWNAKLILLIITSTLINFGSALALEKETRPARKKTILILCIIANLALLGFFKYFNFFISSFNDLLSLSGFQNSLTALKIILPIGISFYTFQAMSYTIDVYWGKTKATKNLIDFAVYVSFFPQLIAGPIERSERLLSQIQHSRKFNLDQFYEGSFLFFWGLYKKIFIADNLAEIVNSVFSYQQGPVGSLWIGLYAFAFQIYCDFSAYSDMARGLAKTLGIEIVLNFNLPYFATNPREFWKRWHISLSEWLRDYIYIPLGGNRQSKLKTNRNLMITMLLGGLWHGANWTFVIWGGLHGLLLIIHRKIQFILKPIFPQNKFQPLIKILSILLFFHVICLTWLPFRTESITQLFYYIPSLFQLPSLQGLTQLLGYLWLLLLVQILQYKKNDLLIQFKQPILVRSLLYVLMFYMVIILGNFGYNEFIYFQF